VRATRPHTGRTMKDPSQPDQTGDSSYWDFEPLPQQATMMVTPGDDPGTRGQQQPVGQGAWQVPGDSSVLSVPPVPPQRRRRRSSVLGLIAACLVVVLLALLGSTTGFGLGVATHRAPQATATAGPVLQAGQTPVVGSRAPTATPTQIHAVRPTPQATPQATSPTPTPMPPVRQGPVILAQDDFQRPDQVLWGTASDGSRWGGEAATSPFFSIRQGAGIIVGGRGFFNAILGPRMRNEEVVASAQASHLDVNNDNLGVVLRWQDNNNYYKAYIDGNSLILIKRVAGTVTRLGAVPLQVSDGVAYSLRFQVAGTLLQVRAWASSRVEPTNWMIRAVDTSLQVGEAGLRVLVEPQVMITVSLFQERTVL
jgi:hypothetical protein